MPRVFAYCRVSTTDQATQNQSMEINAAGFTIEAHRLIEESISGSVAAKERPGFIKLIDRMESGDVLVVTKLDRLGRNAIDVRATVVERLDAGAASQYCRDCARIQNDSANNYAGKGSSFETTVTPKRVTPVWGVFGRD